MIKKKKNRLRYLRFVQPLFYCVESVSNRYDELPRRFVEIDNTMCQFVRLYDVVADAIDSDLVKKACLRNYSLEQTQVLLVST